MVKVKICANRSVEDDQKVVKISENIRNLIKNK